MCKRCFQGFSGDARALWTPTNPQGIFGIGLKSDQVLWVEETHSPFSQLSLGGLNAALENKDSTRHTVAGVWRIS